MTGTPVPKKIWTILDLITWGTAYLTEKNFADARLTIELLLSHVLSLQRIHLYTKFDTPLRESELARFKELLKRRLSFEPIQYIIGETEFMGLPFFVDPAVLIPRPDTEILVESAIAEIRRSFGHLERIETLDIGTGSGCIAVSMAKLHPAVTVTAIDLSAPALAVAQRNAERNGVTDRITFEQRDYREPSAPDRQFHCILSNPPYISSGEYSVLAQEVKDFEPSASLTDGGDGLSFFRLIAARSREMLVHRGFIIVEHAFDQSASVQAIFADHGWSDITSIKDYGGHFRCVMAFQP